MSTILNELLIVFNVVFNVVLFYTRPDSPYNLYMYPIYIRVFRATVYRIYFSVYTVDVLIAYFVQIASIRRFGTTIHRMNKVSLDLMSFVSTILCE